MSLVPSSFRTSRDVNGNAKGLWTVSASLHEQHDALTKNPGSFLIHRIISNEVIRGMLSPLTPLYIHLCSPEQCSPNMQQALLKSRIKTEHCEIRNANPHEFPLNIGRSVQEKNQIRTTLGYHFFYLSD